MALTDIAIRNAKPGDRPRKLYDGSGLYLILSPNGSRWWRLRYLYDGREKLLSLGVYPQVSLAQARRQCAEAKVHLAEGLDPSVRRKAIQDAKRREGENTFEHAADAWLAFKAADWSEESRRKAEYVTRSYLIPKIGSHPIATMTGRDVAPVLRKIAEHAPDLARKARQYVQNIVLHAMLEGLRDEGRMLVLDGVLPSAAGKSHIPAVTLPEDAAALIRAIRAYPTEVVRAALLLCAYTAQRPGVVAAMRWDEVALEAGEWRIPAAKMKTRHTHIVPLPRQALALIRSMHVYSAGRDHVFPPLARQKTPHLHRDALSKALRIMGFAGQHATHGFRATLRTLGRERLGIDSDVLEAQLAHAKRGEVQAAYDRTTFTDARRKAMQRWADWLDEQARKAIPVAAEN